MSSAPTPRLSVVTPTHRRPDLLERLLDSLREQTVAQDDFEIVVIDDGSGDDTPDLLERSVRAMPNLSFAVHEEPRGPAAARNHGVDLSHAPLVLFLDDDVEADRDLIDTHLRYHAEADDPNLGILGRVDWAPDLDITPFMRWLDTSGLQFAYDTWLREGPVEPPYAAFYTANLSMSRDLLVTSGGFDERFPYPAYEDMELAWRLHALGFRMDYRPAAHVFHTRAIDLPTFKRRMSRAAESAVLLGAVQPDFPLSPEHTPEHWDVAGPISSRVRSLRLRFRDDPAARAALYKAAIGAAYRDGLRRGREVLAERAQTPARTTRT
jgi:GT2 family glycosyltransferase